jgi:SP family general alpha glucoside:H+ symporter-like MFS transporter
LGSFWGQPAFIHRFGDLQPDGTYTVNANWQSAISNAMSAGQVIGLIITGYCQERFGSKKTYIGGMAAFTAAIFIPVFAPNIKVLLAGETILAIPLGMFRRP